MLKRRVALIGLLAIVASSLAACGDDDDTSSATADDPSASGSSTADERCTEERRGGSLTVSALSFGLSMDPYTAAAGTASAGLELLTFYDSLVAYDEESGEFVGRLAESIERNEDASEWTLKLREGIEFGNGDPLDAAAVKASIDRNLDPDGTSRMKSAANAIASVDVVDPLTVRFVLTKPWGFFPVHLAAGGGGVGALGMITNVKLVEERGADAFGQDPTGGGAGAYEIKRWAPPEEVVLQAKDDWWGGPVCIEEIRFIALSSGQARLDAMRSGDLDMGTLYEDPVVAAEAKEEFEHVNTIHQAGKTLEFNMANPELADVRVRRAMALAIDPDVVDERAYGGLGLPGTGLVNPASTMLEPTEGIEYDPEAAKDLVEELKAEGMELSYTYIGSDQATNVEAALAVEAMLEAAGFEIELENVPNDQLNAKVIGERNFELVRFGNVGPEVTLYASLYKLAGDNPANFYSYSDPDYDAALERVQAAIEIDELQAGVEELQQVVNETVPFVVSAAIEGGWYWRDDVKGLTFTRGVTPYFDAAYIEG